MLVVSPKRASSLTMLDTPLRRRHNFFMMKICVALTVCFFLTSCTQRVPLIGLLYSDLQSGVAATPQIGPKVGRACSVSYAGLVATGDSSIEAARLNGGILSIASVDEEIKSVALGLYATHCTIVRGK